MSTMICPMLSALAPVDPDGRPVNRECIYEQCRFFHREQRDCNLMLGSRAAAHVAASAAAAGTTSSAQQAAAAIGEAVIERIAGLESVAAGLAASLAQIEKRVGGLVEMHEKVADRLLEEMSLIQMNIQKAERSAAGLEPRLGALDQALAGLDQKTSGFDQQLAGLDQKTSGLDQRFAAIDQQITTLAHTATGIDQKIARAVEGNQLALQALEARLAREQADLSARRHEEAVSCNNRGVALYYRGSLEAAMGAFRKALELMPEYAEACNNLGLVYSRLGKEPEAIDAFRRALTIDPAMGEVYNNLGFLYHSTSQLERAAQMFGQALENAADSSVAYTNLGNTYYQMKQPEKAVEAWRRAVDLDPLNENARRGLRMFQQEASQN